VLIALVALGCGRGVGPGSAQTDQARSFQGIIRILDRDGDGALDRSEYATVAPGEPEFSDVDLDGDGSLSSTEIRALALRVDPDAFDPSLSDPAGLSVPANQGLLTQDPLAAQVRFRERSLREAFLFEEEEIRARDPGARLPSLPEIDAAALDGPSSPRAADVAGRIGKAAARAGLVVPSGFEAAPHAR
jgi:hypothetical protein